jgi:hypothetical protein
MLQVILADNGTNFRPGHTIAGTVRWQFSKPPKRFAVNLGWSTRGKGSEDSEVIDSAIVESPATKGEHAFRFTAPASPYSFSGRLISLVWTLEATTASRDESAVVEIVIAPGGREIELPKLESAAVGGVTTGSR